MSSLSLSAVSPNSILLSSSVIIPPMMIKQLSKLYPVNNISFGVPSMYQSTKERWQAKRGRQLASCKTIKKRYDIKDMMPFELKFVYTPKKNPQTILFGMIYLTINLTLKTCFLFHVLLVQLFFGDICKYLFKTLKHSVYINPTYLG